jgi:hypothetical protein
MPKLKLASGLDAGAGVGRVTKHLLLHHCKTVHLVEASPVWSRQSRRYLGKKRGKGGKRGVVDHDGEGGFSAPLI